MSDFDIEAIRTEIRALKFVRGTAAEVVEWREADADARANLVIENMTPAANEDAFHEMVLDEGVPPFLVSQIVLRLIGHPDADPALAITPVGSW